MSQRSNMRNKELQQIEQVFGQGEIVEQIQHGRFIAQTLEDLDELEETIETASELDQEVTQALEHSWLEHHRQQCLVGKGGEVGQQNQAPVSTL